MGSLMRTIVGSMVGVLLVLALGAGVTAWKLDDKEGIAKRSWLQSCVRRGDCATALL